MTECAPPVVDRGFQHEALVYDGDQRFLAAAVPFVRDGVRTGEPVMVAVANPRLRMLQSAVGRDGDHVLFVDMAEVGRNPARIIPAWLAFLTEHGGADRPARGIGEPIWSGRSGPEIAECQLHEALLNLAVRPDVPFWLLCPYDAAALPADVLSELQHSHPAIRDGAAFRGSPSYAGVAHVMRLFTGSLPDPPPHVTALPFGGGDVARARHHVSRAAVQAGVPDDRAADIVAAVTEIATNSVWYGGGGTLRIWEHADSFVCEVRDQGRIDDPLVGRRPPRLAAEGGRGVWLANQLCDLVQIRSAPAGTTVRITTWL